MTDRFDEMASSICPYANLAKGEAVLDLMRKDIAKSLRTVAQEERRKALEEAAQKFEPNCSCPTPCDDYFIWPSGCAKKAAAVLRAFKDQPTGESGT